MRISVRPFATIRDLVCIRHIGHGGLLSMDLPSGSRLRDLLEVFGLDSVTGVVAVSKGRVLAKDSLLDEGQEVALFPYLAGG